MCDSARVGDRVRVWWRNGVCIEGTIMVDRPTLDAWIIKDDYGLTHIVTRPPQITILGRTAEQPPTPTPSGADFGPPLGQPPPRVYRRITPLPPESPSDSATLFACPSCDGFWFQVVNDGSLICASQYIDKIGCGWKGAPPRQVTHYHADAPSVLRQPHPGDIYYDETGEISDGVPATYLILSGQRNDDDHNAPYIWQAARFRALLSDTTHPWLGTTVYPLNGNTEIPKLRYVGTLSMDHLRKGTTRP